MITLKILFGSILIAVAILLVSRDESISVAEQAPHAQKQFRVSSMTTFYLSDTSRMVLQSPFSEYDAPSQSFVLEQPVIVHQNADKSTLTLTSQQGILSDKNNQIAFKEKVWIETFGKYANTVKTAFLMLDLSTNQARNNVHNTISGAWGQTTGENLLLSLDDNNLKLQNVVSTINASTQK